MRTTTPIITENGYAGSEPSITAEIRARIIELIRSGMGCNATAREVGVGSNTVHRIAKDIGQSFGQAAERTEMATTARRSQLAKRRTDLAEQAHTVAEEAGAYALFRLRNRPDDLGASSRR